MGSVLCDGAAIAKVAGQLRADHFYDPVNGMIYSAMLEQYGRHEPIDLVTLSNELKAVGRYEDAGGAHYLTGLMQVVPSSSNVKRYANIVIEKYRYRATSEEAAKLALEAEREEEECFERLAKMHNIIFCDGQNEKSIHEIYEQTCEWIETKHDWPVTGYYDVDKLIDLEEGTYVIVGGATSMGKTAFCLNTAANIAFKQNRPVVYFSLEMTERQLVTRLISAELKIPKWLLKNGKLKESKDWLRIINFGPKLIASKFRIIRLSTPTTFDVKARMQEILASLDAKIFYVDYIQKLISPSTKTNESRNAEVSAISGHLQTIAKDFNVCVIAGSQIIREASRRSNTRPTLFDLRDSGSLENDADIVIFPYRPEYYERPKGQQEKNWENAEIIIAKDRNGGGTGDVPVWWMKDYGRFENPEKPEQQAKGW